MRTHSHIRVNEIESINQTIDGRHFKYFDEFVVTLIDDGKTRKKQQRQCFISISFGALIFYSLLFECKGERENAIHKIFLLRSKYLDTVCGGPCHMLLYFIVSNIFFTRKKKKTENKYMRCCWPISYEINMHSFWVILQNMLNDWLQFVSI